jgi:tyrosinase
MPYSFNAEPRTGDIFMAQTAPKIRIRPDIHKLKEWDDPVLWYARAVEQMKKRALNDFSSWRYQAAIHDYDPDSDPLASSGDVKASDSDKFWAKCQHSSWFFLPWHRMYLFHFEQIVAKTIRDLNGPEDWALPFWNYSDAGAHAAQLPAAFRDKKWPGGSGQNPLYVKERDTHINAGSRLAPSSVSLNSLKDGNFIGVVTGAHPGFGGPKTRFNHDAGPVGALEQTPHGNVHVGVGGMTGFMSAFNTAPLDPIFWLHHANIDRLWEVWRRTVSHSGTQFKNPTDADWLQAKNATFLFHDVTGAEKKFVPGDALDTRAAPLFYEYEGVPPAPLAPPAAIAEEEMIMAEAQPPAEMVGAKVGVSLAAGLTTTQVQLQPASGPAALAAEPERPKRLFLNLENITSNGRVPVYDVYLNVPEADADPSGHSALLAGSLPMFGVVEATRSSNKHAGSGLTYVLEITDLVADLKRQNRWNPANLAVTFKSHAPVPDSSNINVGRISLFEQ